MKLRVKKWKFLAAIMQTYSISLVFIDCTIHVLQRHLVVLSQPKHDEEFKHSKMNMEWNVVNLMKWTSTKCLASIMQGEHLIQFFIISKNQVNHKKENKYSTTINMHHGAPFSISFHPILFYAILLQHITF